MVAAIKPHYRQRIYAAYRLRGGDNTRLNDYRRVLLTEAIFAVEDDLEHRRPFDPQVRLMNEVRNRLYDDLGWNEYPTNP